MKTCSSTRPWCTEPLANGPDPCTVFQILMVEAARMTIDVTGCLRRTAAVITNGKMTNSSGWTPTLRVSIDPNVMAVTMSVEATRTAVSRICRRWNRKEARHDVRRAGATMSAPTASPSTQSVQTAE